jgi:hypothetical protein
MRFLDNKSQRYHERALQESDLESDRSSAHVYRMPSPRQQRGEGGPALGLVDEGVKDIQPGPPHPVRLPAYHPLPARAGRGQNGLTCGLFDITERREG